jgi:hypothetical protein
MSRTRFAAIATFVVLSCAGCADDGSPKADPSPSPSTSMPASTATTPTAVPAYLDRFSERQRQAYDDAVQAYQDFAGQQATYMAAGEATPAAKRFYVRRTADWQTFWATLDVCGVSTGVKVSQNGSPIPQPKPVPTIVRVGMVKLDGESHWRVLYERVGPKC